MARSGRKFVQQEPRIGSKPLVTPAQDRAIKEKDQISFSFSFFRQIENFGIGNCQDKWFVGLLQRLFELSSMTLKQLRLDNAGSSALRFHPIDWEAKSIPIQRKNLNWLPMEILENEEEFPMMQISISRATGRIVGYFNNDSSIFYIVLLDPNHNAQPSKKNNYQIQQTNEGRSQYDELLKQLSYVKEIVRKCPHEECVLGKYIEEMDGLHRNIMYFCLDDDFYQSIQDILKSHSLRDVIENGIFQMMEAK